MPHFDPPQPRPIATLAAELGLTADQVEPYGWYTGKFALGVERSFEDRPRGKYVAVTAINPTPLGEGKTVVAIGLAMALCRLGRPAIATLRQPSLGPLLGIKGGGAGGGRATLLPADDINLHFTGDSHAVTAATNVLAALIDNHRGRGLEPRLIASSIDWQRAVDICDRDLQRIKTGLAFPDPARHRETGFLMTPASEIMAILSLATSIDDLRQRLGRIVVGRAVDGRIVTAEDLRAGGALTALLRDALRPNLVQTCEHTPALVHTGPFANISHGNSSVLADLLALRLGEFVVTESGFGTDCGAEKLFDIKCRTAGLRPDAVVLVATIRALKLQSGRFDVQPGRSLPEQLTREDREALAAGADHLRAHLEMLARFGLPIVVAINRFPTDTPDELEDVRTLVQASGVAGAAVVDAYERGGAGAEELAQLLLVACQQPSQFQYLYPLELSLEEKVERIATQIYGADGVDWSPASRQQIERHRRDGFGQLPVCVAKTPYSLSHDPKRLGRPRDFRLPVREVRLAAGAGYLYALAGDIRTMPGLPASPNAHRIDVDADGRITGLS